jgi:hypothetical protein
MNFKLLLLNALFVPTFFFGMSPKSNAVQGSGQNSHNSRDRTSKNFQTQLSRQVSLSRENQLLRKENESLHQRIQIAGCTLGIIAVLAMYQVAQATLQMLHC